MLHRSLSTCLAIILVLSAALGLRYLPSSAAMANIGYRDFKFGTSCNSTPTGEKPESKLWWNDGRWWGSLCAQDNSYHIFRFDVTTQRWADTGTPLDDRPASKADTLWDGKKLYVASHVFTNSGEPISSPSQWGRLYRYSYNPATKVYSRDAGFPVTITRGKSETLVLEKASSGQLWVTYIESRRVMINHSAGGDSAWGTPIALPVAGASSLHDDDISSIIAFDRGTARPKVGVLWSNQSTKRMYFATHQDGAAASAWSSFSLLVPTGGNPAAADDHVNIKLQSDGVGVYAVTKTSNEGENEPLLVLLSCRSACSAASSWRATPVYTVAERNTRAILLLDISNRKVNIISSTPETGGRIDRAIFDMDTLSSTSVAESKTVFIQNSADTRLNNPTSTKQAISRTTGLLILAGDQESRYYLHNYDSLATLPPVMPTPIGGFRPRSFLPVVR